MKASPNTLFPFMGVLLLACTVLLTISTWTEPYIKANQQQAFDSVLEEILPKKERVTLSKAEAITLSSKITTGTSTLRKAYDVTGTHTATLIETAAKQGYAGPIHLLIAISPKQNILGIRVLSHQETPGLGDKMEIKRSNWIENFIGTSLQEPVSSRWTVKKEGGAFDSWTGATITPKAIIKTVENCLEYLHHANHA